MKAGGEVAQHFDLSNLRLLASVGEPLNPEAVVGGSRRSASHSTTIGGRPRPAES